MSRSAFLAASDSTAANVPEKIAFASEDFDPNGAFDTTNNRFQPTRAGYYQINLQALFQQTTPVGGFTLYLDLRKNGAVHRYAQELINYTASFTQTMRISDTVYMNGTTDYIEGWYYANVGALTVIGGTTATYMSGHFVRD
jgi:hypothetical protein